jgi:hypothetical protein
MTPQDFLLEMDEIFELAAGTLVDIGGAPVSELQVAGGATVADPMRLAKVQDRPS